MEDRYRDLAKKWLDGTITPDEQAEFAAWYNAGQDAPVQIPSDFAKDEEELRQRILNKINRDIKNTGRLRKIFPVWLRAAAAILVVAFGGVMCRLHLKRPTKNQFTLTHKKPTFKNDISPGGNKAILTLANGQKINLSDVKNGVLASQGQTVLKKDKDGRIVYEKPAGKPVDSTSIYNTITIPKGGQFQLVLSDGSRVWLNSASSITFPAAFSKTERKVTITGEVYFQVAKNKYLPFRVVAGKQTIEVLGTHFDVNAYTDEPATKTTLVEGSVRVIVGNQSVTIKPSQQSSVSGAGNISIRTVDTDDVLAWTTGNFQFEKAEIPTIMREAARWYDVEIKYEGDIPQRRFTGSISRSVNLSELLNMLKYTGIHFKIEGKTIVVTS